MPEIPGSKNDLIAALTRSPHGKLTDYVPTASKAVRDDAEFYAHLAAWNARKGKIRDAKVALPILGLGRDTAHAFHDYHLGLFADHGPREFLRAVEFAKDLRGAINQRMIRRLVERYLREYEAEPQVMERAIVQHRTTFKTLYTRWHINPIQWVDLGLFKNAVVDTHRLGVFKTLASLSAPEIAERIHRYRLPTITTLTGALSHRAKEPDVLAAIVRNMTPAELATNAKLLKKLGIQDTGAARAAFEQKLEHVAESGRDDPLLKLSKAADAVDDEKLRKKITAVQEKRLSSVSVQGNWLVLTDRSGSMEIAIDAAVEITAVLARVARGRVRWLLFNDGVRAIETTDKTLEELKAAVKHVSTDGGTSIGVGVQYVLDKGEQYDGIVLVSDGAENAVPLFAQRYADAARRWDKKVPVYWYRVNGDMRKMVAGAYASQGQRLDPQAITFSTHQAERARDLEAERFIQSCKTADIDVQTFDLRGGVDYHSLPNLIQTMRTNRYSLIDEIMDTPLVGLDFVLPLTKTIPVLVGESAHA